MDKDDKIIDDYLKGNSPISKIYKHTQQEECPEEVSDYILSESRKAVRSKPQDFIPKNDLPFDYLEQPAFLRRGSMTSKAEESKDTIKKPKHDWSNLVPIAIAAMLLISIGIISFFPQQPSEYGDPSLTFRGGDKKPVSKDYETPDDWIKAIESLKKEGRLDEAAKLAEEFKKKYPDMPY